MNLGNFFEQAAGTVVNFAPNQISFRRGMAVAGGVGGLAAGGLLGSSLLGVFGLVAGGWYGARKSEDLWLRYRETLQP